jgi:hypothetical protein
MTFLSIYLTALLAFGCSPQEKPVLDRWQTGNAVFEIRVTEYEEKHFPLSKFCYVFEANRRGSTDWREILTVRTDDDIEIPRKQVRFLNDRAAYVFMTNKYAITTNGGDSWSVWEADKATANVNYPGQAFIEDVNVNLDGSGTLVLVLHLNPKQVKKLHTEDFGHSWKFE